MHSSTVTEALKQVQDALLPEVKLVAVSKTKPNELILEAYRAGQRDFGENKAQELIQKSEDLPEDIRWHFIGHLQTNKAKHIVPLAYLIHAVDSLKLLKEIDKQAKKLNKVTRCLLQIHIADEIHKFGLDQKELVHLLESTAFGLLKNVEITGLMGMATNTDDAVKVREEFNTLRRTFETIKQSHFLDQTSFETISMGMTNDYLLAMEEGSNMVRIGSLIFGDRN